MKIEHELISESTIMFKLVERIDAGDIPSNQEMADAFATLSQQTIDLIDSCAAEQGLPALPREWNPGSPEFHAAMERLKELKVIHGNDIRPPAGWADTWAEMMRTAPRWWKAEIEMVAEETIEMPTADYCTEEGKPLYSTKNLSKHFGISEVEIMEHFDGVENDGYFVSSETGVFRTN
jgi:hypothetical protein